MRKYKPILLVLTMAFLSVAGSADGKLIGIKLGLPDILSDSTGAYSYDAESGLFTSSAEALTITFDGETNIPITDGSYSASFYLDSSGEFVGGVSGYDLETYGNFTYENVAYSDLLVAGEVTNFGWENAPGSIALFDFAFDFKEGALDKFYLERTNYLGGDIATVENSDFAGSWEEDHSGTKAKHDIPPAAGQAH